jgi:hypothetical protein
VWGEYLSSNVGGKGYIHFSLYVMIFHYMPFMVWFCLRQNQMLAV